MSFLHISNVRLAGLAGCVPRKILENKDYSGFVADEANKFITATGVERHRIAEGDTCTSDLCYHAAERLIEDLNWRKDEIECLVFVTQTPDYILPATSCLLQERLGLSPKIIALDISLGCSGWVYGLQVISSLLSHGQIKRGILAVGDTILKSCSKEDKSTYPLFGDAGTCTAIEYTLNHPGFNFHSGTDGKGYKAIIIPDGGYRHETRYSSLEKEEIEPGIRRNKLQLVLDGMDVFSFGITTAPETVRMLVDYYNNDLDSVDFYVFHQANLFMNEKIRKKLKLPIEKVPYSLANYGNTSSASIPLTMITELSYKLQAENLNIIACGFGVGLSWGTVQILTDRIICSDLIQI